VTERFLGGRVKSMEHVAVSSSNIESIGYDSDAQKLQVKMKHGKTYEYSKVPESVHRDLMAARVSAMAIGTKPKKSTRQIRQKNAAQMGESLKLHERAYDVGGFRAPAKARTP
jgi:hypothetical protein